MKSQYSFALPFTLLLAACFYFFPSNHNQEEIITLAPVTLLDANFDDGRFPDDWTVEVIDDTGINMWQVGRSNSIGSTSAAVVSANNNIVPVDIYDSSDPDANDNNIILRTQFIDATHIIDLQLSFTWGAGGESDASNPPLFDYGSLVYSFNGSNYINIEDFAGDGVVLLTPATGTYNIELDFLEGQQFYIGFRWINDQLVSSGTSFAIDDVLLTGERTGLAVEMLDFNANLIDNLYTQLTWETTNEYQNKGFDILRSFDGTAFEKIGFAPSKLNGNAVNTYTFQDNDLKKGVHYYRLRQMDNNGKSNNSKTVSVDVTSTAAAFEVYPTQIQESFTIEFDKALAADASLQLLDMNGRLLKTIPLSSNILQQKVNLSDLNLGAGTYLLSLQNNGTIHTTTLIKQ